MVPKTKQVVNCTSSHFHEFRERQMQSVELPHPVSPQRQKPNILLSLNGETHIWNTAQWAFPCAKNFLCWYLFKPIHLASTVSTARRKRGGSWPSSPLAEQRLESPTTNSLKRSRNSEVSWRPRRQNA